MKKAAWTDYSMTLSGASNSTTLKFEAVNTKDNRFFLDEVKITKAEGSYFDWMKRSFEVADVSNEALADTLKKILITQDISYVSRRLWGYYI